ncbi:MAG: transglycosylase SLT domain-containing protein [Xanthomonadaceae bacterium]|nr:transglycosylase SLT domain-containing protein [Xanthomonadaceae bacterium]
MKIPVKNQKGFSSLFIATVFLLIVALTGSWPAFRSMLSGPVRATQAPKEEVIVPLKKSSYCSLADFDHLTANIEQLRRGISYQRAAKLTKYIWLAGYRFNCDPQLIAALIQVESSFFSRARSHKGALGLMQLRPFVARAVALQLETSWSGPQVLHDPETNILIGTYYLVSLIRDFPDLATALVAYNCGPSYVRRRLRQGMRLPTRYPAKIMTLYQSFATNRS